MGFAPAVPEPSQGLPPVYALTALAVAIKQFRGSDRIESTAFPNFALAAEEIFQAGRAV